MTDTRFLSNNSVTCEANLLKCESLMQDSWAYKSPSVEIGQRLILLFISESVQDMPVVAIER